MQIALVVAMSENRVIGKDNQLPWHLPNDLRHFKNITQGKTILMGRKTYESIGRPLPHRKNIVMTRDKNYQAEGIIVVNSIKQAIMEVSAEEEVFVIGGGELFAELMDKASRIYLTVVHADIEGDVFFPPIDTVKWTETSREDHFADEKHAYDYSFFTLKKN